MPRFPNVSKHAHSVSARVYSNLEQRALAKNEAIYRLHVGDTYRDPVPRRGRSTSSAPSIRASTSTRRCTGSRA